MHVTEVELPFLPHPAVAAAELAIHVVDEGPLLAVLEEDPRDAGSAGYDRGHDFDHRAETPLLVRRMRYAVAQAQEQPFPFVQHVITERNADYPKDSIISTRLPSLDTLKPCPQTPDRFMGQDWKTLGAVVIGAALAGWLVVRVLSGGSATLTAPTETARATTVAPQRTAAEVAIAEPATAPAAAPEVAKPAPVQEPPPADNGDEGAAIARDLAALAQALQRDVRIEDRVMPRVNDVLDVPGTTEYRRGPDFWEPALASGPRGAR